MPVDTIVFDFGGVLIDWNPRYLYRKVFKNESEMERFLTEICSMKWNETLDRGKPFRQAVKELSALHPEYAAEIEMYDTRWGEMRGAVKTKSVDVLKRVSQKYNVYGLTNFSEEKLKETMKKYDFFNLFKGIVVSGIEREVKPEEKIFRILMNRYNVIPANAVFIDDSLPNVMTAKSLGFNTIHFIDEDQFVRDLKKTGVEVD